MDRQEMQADIVVTGFGPAAAGFLATIGPELAKTKEDGTPLYESKVMPGCPLQVMCYERADDPGFGVSGIVTKGTAIKASFPDLDLAKEIPNAIEVKEEKLAYLFDHLGCSKRTLGTKMIDLAFKMGGVVMRGGKWKARELPFIPPFMDKKPGLVLQMGSFMTWAAQKVMESGLMIMPGMPVAGPLFEGDKVTGVTTMLMDEGLDTGDILRQYRIALAEDETGGSLFDRLAALGVNGLSCLIDQGEPHICLLLTGDSPEAFGRPLEFSWGGSPLARIAGSGAKM